MADEHGQNATCTQLIEIEDDGVVVIRLSRTRSVLPGLE